MVCIAGFDNFRHITSEVNYTARVAAESESLLVSEPSVSEGRIAFTKLGHSGYTIGSLAGKRTSSLATNLDLFHPAAIPQTSEAFVELAGTTSRIVRIDLDNSPVSEEGLLVEVHDGERPFISSDGRWLAFIREVRGRGSLWIKSLQAEEAGEFAGGEWELAGPEYDVLEATVDAQRSEVIFAGQPGGAPALFIVGRTSSRITQSTFGSASRYPAVSPNGLWLAYSKLNKGSWQIWLKPRDSNLSEGRQLTTGDCNSISPAWTPDSKDLIYATDCGRGVGLTALARIRAVE